MLRGTRTLLVAGVFVLGAAPLQAQRRPITVVEIERAGALIRTAFDAVSTLRPRWLEAPHEMTQVPSMGQDAKVAVVHVYLDDRDLGGVDYLKNIPVERVAEIHWYSTNEAGSHFGPSAGPVIEVTLKRLGGSSGRSRAPGARSLRPPRTSRPRPADASRSSGTCCTSAGR